MPNSDSKFKFVQERLEFEKIVAIPNIIVASHTLISLRNIPSVMLIEPIGIAAMQRKLQISIEGDIIRYSEGHLTKALEFIEKSVLLN